MFCLVVVVFKTQVFKNDMGTKLYICVKTVYMFWVYEEKKSPNKVQKQPS